MSNGLFDNVDDEDDQLFKDIDAKKPSSRETTPEFFSEVKLSDDMNLFSPSKPKDTLFDFDDDNDTTKETKQEDDDLNDDEVEPKSDNISEEPLGFLKNEEANEDDQEDREEFELIDSTEVPSVEEAERQLEIARQESERIKKEQEEEQRREEEGEESQDGAGFSRVFGGSAASDSPTNVEVPAIHDSDEVEEKDVSNENNDKLVEELQQEVSQLTASLQSAQAENGGLSSEVSELRIQLTEEKDENNKLREELKKKDAEIASLKETIAAAGGKPPKPTTRKPSVSTAKQSTVSSPRSTSARLKQDAEKKSVAETAKRFNQPESKKTSPSLRRPIKKDSVDKADSRIPRQDSATRKASIDSPSASDKKSSSPPKPVRSKARPDTKSEASPMISHKPQRNTLDAIKLWEQKTGDKKEETSPTVVKKPLTTVNSAPHVGEDTTKENGEENLPPSNDEIVVEAEEDTVTEEQKSPIRKGTGNAARQRKTESMIVSGSKSKRWIAPTVDKCQVCNKTVYPMERLLADEKMYHKTCFRCSHCKKVIGLGTYAANKGEIFCKTHFKMLFKIKGNYDEGFGRTQHKTKWAKGQGGAADQDTKAAD